MMLIEIGNFSELRRALGVERADLLTLDIAERVAMLLPEATVGTAGRNLVEVALPVEDAIDIAPAVAAIRTAFAGPVVIGGVPRKLDLLIGAAASDGGADEVVLIEQAEQQLVRARAGYAAARPEETAGTAAAIGRDLQDAIPRGELFLQYQPKLHLRQQTITGVEALIRWQHPRRGLVPPNDFIPQAERTGDIAQLTLWTVRQVIADQQVLARNGHDLPVYINMAGALLSDGAFVDEMIGLIGDRGPRLGVEITETSVIKDPQGAIRHLQRLADIGVAVVIDDYGAGLSSLAYLKQLPACELKIDKLFVTQLTSSNRDPLIVRSTIDLAHALEMQVVAEGVETPASLALLTVMGCDMVQGFLISRPLALEALLAFLREERHLHLMTMQPLPFERLAAVRAQG